MSKEQVIADAKASFALAEDQILGQVFDQAQAEVPVGGGGFTQADIDNAVAAAVAPIQAQLDAQLAKDIEDEANIQAGKDALAALQAQFDLLASKEALEAGTLADLQLAKDKLQKVLSDLMSIGQPEPTPEPQPEA